MTSHNMNLQKFAGVNTWVFDLDQCLYPKASGLETEVLYNLRRCLACALNISLEEASFKTDDYYNRFGGTVQGAIINDGLEPSKYLEAVYWNVNLNCIDENLPLRKFIQQLPGRKIVFTNSTHYHAERVLEKLGLAGVFEVVFDVSNMDYSPKPSKQAFDMFLKQTGINPKTTAFFEDSVRNLKVGKSLGMKTVHIGKDKATDSFIDASVQAPEDFLQALHASDVLTS